MSYLIHLKTDSSGSIFLPITNYQLPISNCYSRFLALKRNYVPMPNSQCPTLINGFEDFIELEVFGEVCNDFY